VRYFPFLKYKPLIFNGFIRFLLCHGVSCYVIGFHTKPKISVGKSASKTERLGYSDSKKAATYTFKQYTAGLEIQL